MPRWTNDRTPYAKRNLRTGERFETVEDPGPEDRGVVLAASRHHFTTAPALLRFDDGYEAEATRAGHIVGEFAGLRARPVVR